MADSCFRSESLLPTTIRSPGQYLDEDDYLYGDGALYVETNGEDKSITAASKGNTGEELVDDWTVPRADDGEDMDVSYLSLARTDLPIDSETSSAIGDSDIQTKSGNRLSVSISRSSVGLGIAYAGQKSPRLSVPSPRKPSAPGLRNSLPHGFRVDSYIPSRPQQILPSPKPLKKSCLIGPSVSPVRPGVGLPVITAPLVEDADPMEDRASTTDTFARFQRIVEATMSTTVSGPATSTLALLTDMCHIAPQVLEAWKTASRERDGANHQLTQERGASQTLAAENNAQIRALYGRLSAVVSTQKKTMQTTDSHLTIAEQRQIDRLELVEAEKVHLQSSVAGLTQDLRKAREDLVSVKAISLDWREKFVELDRDRERIDQVRCPDRRQSFVSKPLPIDHLDLARELEEVKKRLRAKEHVSDKWKEDFEKAAIDREHLQMDLRSVQTELDAVRRDAETSHAANWELLTKNSSLLSDRSELQARQIRLADEIRQMIEDHSASIFHLEESLREEQEKNEHLQRTSEEGALQWARARDNELVLSGTIGKLQLDNESRLDICKRTARYRAERDTAKAALKSAQGETLRLKELLRVREPELQATKQALEGKEGECGQLGDEAGKLEAELNDLRKSYAVVERLCDTADRVAEGRTKEAEKARLEATVALAQAEGMASRLDVEMDLKRELEKTNRELEATIAQLHVEANWSKQESHAAAIAHSALEQRFVSLRAKLEVFASAATQFAVAPVHTMDNDLAAVDTAISAQRGLSQETDSEAITFVSADLDVSGVLETPAEPFTGDFVPPPEASQQEATNRRLARKKKRLESDIARLEGVKIADAETMDVYALLRSYESAWRKSEMALAATRKNHAALEAQLKGTGMSMRRKRKLDAIADMDPTEEVAGLRRLLKRLQRELKPKCPACISLHEPDTELDHDLGLTAILNPGEGETGQIDEPVSEMLPS